MTASLALHRPFATLSRFLLLAVFAVVSACGSGDAPPLPQLAPTAPPTVPPVTGPIPPTITQQPASVTTMPGQSASFSVAATGTAPLAYQWQRSGVAIPGATSTTYTLASTAQTDSGVTFRVVVSNVAGSATSNDATLTVTATSPVLAISPQPVNQTVTAGAMASFTVGATCSSGTVTIQWQRLAVAAFVDLPGATAPTYAFTAAIGDSGAQFRAAVSCSGASATTSNVATLTVTAPSSVTLSLLPVTGLRNQAPIGLANGIDPAPGGGWDFTSTHAIRHLSADLSTVTLVAGGNGNGSADGPAASATFNSPAGLVHDAAGNIYVADTANNTIRRIATDGTVTTLAGTAGTSGATDGTGAAASFSAPAGIALGPDGDLYVIDRNNASIRRVTLAGVVTTYAGGTPGFLDGAPTAARFSNPYGLVAVANGDLYVADGGNQRIRRIARSGTTAGAVTTLAGNGTFTTPGVDGVGTAASIPFPFAIAVRGMTLFVLDYGGNLRTIDTTTAVVTTFAGSSLGTGYSDGPLGAAQFDTTSGGIALQGATGLVVANNTTLRTVDATGTVTTIARQSFISPEGTGVLAQLPFVLDSSVNLPPTSVVTDALGRVAVSENGTRLVRRIDPSGTVSLVAGLAFGDGLVDGVGRAAKFRENGTALAAAPDGTLYTSDQYGVRRVATDGTTTLLAGSDGAFGGVDGTATNARFNRIAGLAVGPTGDVFVGDFANNAIRRIDAAGNTTTFAGAIGQSGAADGPRTSARFQGPQQLAFAPDGSLYVLDRSTIVTGASLRRIAADGTVTTLNSGLDFLRVAVDPNGTVYAAVNNFSSQSVGTVDVATGNFTPVIRTAATVTLGSVAPSLGPTIGSISAHGTRQLVIVSGAQLLLLTLP